MPGALVRRGPGGALGRATGSHVTVAITVAVIAQPARTAVGGLTDGRVDDLQRAGDVGIGGGQLAEAYELEETGVDHRTLVQGRTAVADVVADSRVRVTGLGQTDEVGVGRQRAVGGDCPLLDVPLVGVRGREPYPGVCCVTVLLGDGRAGDQTGDLGCNRGGRVPGLLFPSLRAVGRPVTDQV